VTPSGRSEAHPECHPESLRAAGWSQGCRLKLDLPMDHIVVVNGQVQPDRSGHSDWVLAEQDCDLAWGAIAGSDTTVELRPVFETDPPAHWGIRSSTFRLDLTGAHLRAGASSVRVTPDVVLKAQHESCAHPASARRLKTWLGLRYDRPAVPEPYLKLAKDLAERLRKRKHRPAEERLRDILVEFAVGEDGATEFKIVAVAPHREAEEDPSILLNIRTWLSEVVLAVPEELGVPSAVEAVRDDQVSLAYLEHAYSLDVSSVSWPDAEPGPRGEAR